MITNLSNFIHPIIRFEITDCVIMHNELCGCGKDSMWLEVEGRTDDINTFGNGGKAAPLALYALLKEVDNIQRFQLVQTKNDVLELRLTAENKIDAFEEGKRALQRYLMENGIEAEIILSGKEPEPNPYSGKYKHIVPLCGLPLSFLAFVICSLAQAPRNFLTSFGINSMIISESP